MASCRLPASLLLPLGVAGIAACQAGSGSAGASSASLASRTIDVTAGKALPVPEGQAAQRVSSFASSRGAGAGLLVWRTDDEPASPSYGWQVYASPISPDGATATDLPLFSIAGAGGRVAGLDFDGTNHVVLAQDGRLLLRRVAPDGHASDGAPVVVAGAGARSPSLAFDGTAHLVTWASPQAEEAKRDLVQARRYDLELAPASAPITIGSAATTHGPVRTAGARGAALVVWGEPAAAGTQSERIAFVAADGGVRELASVEVEGRTRDLAVGSSGDVFLLARRTRDDVGETRLELARVSADGEPIDHDPVIFEDQGSLDVSDLAVTFDGEPSGTRGRWLVSWRDTHRTQVRAVSGDLVTSATTTLDTPRGAPAELLPLGTGALAIAGDASGGLSATRLDDALRPVGTEAARIGVRDSRQTVRAVGASDAAYLVVYADDRASAALPLVPQRLFAQRVGAGGGGDPIGEATLLGDDFPVSGGLHVASDGKDFLALDHRRGPDGAVFRALLVRGEDGALGEPARFASADPGEGSAAVLLHDGAQYVVVWMSGAGRLSRTRVRSDGTLLDEAPQLLGDLGPDAADSDVAAAIVDGALVVVWQENCPPASCGIAGERLYGMRFDGDEPLEPLDLGTRGPLGVLRAATDGHRAIVATDERAFVVLREGPASPLEAWTAGRKQEVLFDGLSFMTTSDAFDAATFERSSLVRQIDPATGADVEKSELVVPIGAAPRSYADRQIAARAGGRSLVAFSPMVAGARTSGLRVRAMTSKAPPHTTPPPAQDDPGDDGSSGAVEPGASSGEPVPPEGSGGPRPGGGVEDAPPSARPGESLPRVDELRSAEASCSTAPGGTGDRSGPGTMAALVAAVALAGGLRARRATQTHGETWRSSAKRRRA